MDLYAFMGISCTWKVYRLMLHMNDSDAEIRVLFKYLVRLKQFRLLLTSMGFTPTLPTKAYEDNWTITNSITSHRITPPLRRIYITLCYMHNKHEKGTFDTIKNPSRIQLENTGVKPESRPTLLRNTSTCMVHMHIIDLTDSHFQPLSAPSQISCYKHYCRTNYLSLHGCELNIL